MRGNRKFPPISCYDNIDARILLKKETGEEIKTCNDITIDVLGTTFSSNAFD